PEGSPRRERHQDLTTRTTDPTKRPGPHGPGRFRFRRMTLPPPLDARALECLRQAGRVAADVREAGARLIVPGAPVRDVSSAVGDDIARRGAGAAFPVQSSRNDVAAHDCPAPSDEARYAEGDVAKLDIGVHVEGWVVDTALTVSVGDRPEHRRLVE